MLKNKSIRFAHVGILNLDVGASTYLEYDSDREDNVSRNFSANATPSRSSHCSSRSISESPACTPGSITKELTEIVDSQLVKTPVLTSKKRKRLLSEMGERELTYPICDYRTARLNWKGCSFLKTDRLCGVGLYNPSNYCFLNSVLQSIVHTAQLARYLVEFHNECVARMPCLHCSLKRHILRCMNSQEPVDGNWMRQFFAKIFPSHRRDHQEDAHEMLTLILSALEPPFSSKKLQQNGLATSTCGITSTNTNGNVNSMINGSMSKTSANGLKSPKKSEASTPIEQIFGGNLRNKITCDVCLTSYTNYEKIREINVGLLPKYQGQAVKLSTLINDFFNVERLQGFMCKNCKCKRSAIRNTSVLNAPSILIIQLKRFNIFGGKNRLVVRPEPVLHLDKFMYNKQSERYKFSGVIEHIGGGLNFGHYVSAFCGFDERSWFHFDDSYVTPIDEQKALQMAPYIIFYTKIHNNKLCNGKEQLACAAENFGNGSEVLIDTSLRVTDSFTNNINENNSDDAHDSNGNGVSKNEFGSNGFSNNGLHSLKKRSRFSTESPQTPISLSNFKPAFSLSKFDEQAQKSNSVPSTPVSFTILKKQQVQQSPALLSTPPNLQYSHNDKSYNLDKNTSNNPPLIGPVLPPHLASNNSLPNIMKSNGIHPENGKKFQVSSQFNRNNGANKQSKWNTGFLGSSSKPQALQGNGLSISYNGFR